MAADAPGGALLARRPLALLVSALVAIGVAGATPARADGPGTGSPYVVSVGDSYISGEAGRWAGNTNTGESHHDDLGPTAYFDNAGRTAESINRCHRSISAEIFSLDFYSGAQGPGQAAALQTRGRRSSARTTAP